MPGQFGRRQSSLDFQITPSSSANAARPLTASASAVSAQAAAAFAPHSLSRSVRAGAALLHPLAQPASPFQSPTRTPLSPQHHSESALSPQHHSESVLSPQHHSESVLSPQHHSESVLSPQSQLASVGADGRGMDELLREQCVLFVCRRCEQGVVLKALDSTTADSLCGMLEQHDTFGRRVHNDLTLWFRGRQMQAIGSLHDYGVKARPRCEAGSNGHLMPCCRPKASSMCAAAAGAACIPI
jgi:hypothetical protein